MQNYETQKQRNRAEANKLRLQQNEIYFKEQDEQTLAKMKREAQLYPESLYLKPAPRIPLKSIAGLKLPEMMRNPFFFAILVILGFELWLAHAIPSDILTNHDWLKTMINWFQIAVPDLHFINSDTVHRPDAIKFYLFTGYLLFIPLVLLSYLWLRSETGFYRKYFISPINFLQGISRGDRYSELLSGHSNSWDALNIKNYRSVTSRFIWSGLVMLLGFLFSWVLLAHPFEINRSTDFVTKNLYKSFNYEGILLWYQWMVSKVTFIALVLAYSLSLLRDYYIFIKVRLRIEVKS